MLVLSAIGPPPAAAEELPHFISEGVEIVEPLNGRGKLNEFYIEVPGLSFSVLCTGVDGEIVVGTGSKSKLTIEFTKCTVFVEGRELPQCKVKEPIVIDLRDQLIYKKGKKGEEIFDIFYPAAGKFAAGVFTDVAIEGACLVKGHYEVKGSAIAVPSPNTPGKEAKVVKLSFNGKEAPTGSYENQETKKAEEAGELNLTGKRAYLKGSVEQELENGEEYGAL
jgi:hypothetical protein